MPRGMTSDEGAIEKAQARPAIRKEVMADIGNPVREIEIVPSEEPIPQELPLEAPEVPEEELEPV